MGLSRALEEPRWEPSEGRWLRSGSSRRVEAAQDPDGASQSRSREMVGQEDGAGSEKSERKGGGGLRKELEATSHHLPWEHLGPMELDAAESTHWMTCHV